VIGAWSGLAGVTTAIGPFVGGVLIDQWSWRWIFWMNVPLAVLVLWLSLTYVPESRDEQASVRFDVLGAVLGAVALAGLTYALIAWPEDGFGSPRVLLGLAAAVAGGIAFVMVERHKGDAAMMPLRLYESRTFSALNLYTLVVYGAFGGLFFLLVIYLQTVAGFSAFETGLATLPMTVIMLLFSARSGALATRIGPRLQLVAGPLACAAAIMLLRQAGPSPNYWTDMLPAVVIFGIGLTLFVAPLTATVLGAVANHYAGVASGINNTAARAGSLLAVAALPLLVGLSGEEYAQPGPLTESFRAACLWCSGVLIVGALIAAVILPKSARCPKVDLVPDVGLSHRQSRDRVASTSS
jgi:MFS family permease